MSQKGNLSQIKFDKLLLWLARQKKTGTLRVTGLKMSKFILFDKGQIVSSFSEYPEDSFRAVIRRMQLLPPSQQIELELEPGTSDTVFAKKVIERGYVTEREFLEVLKEQNNDIILSLFEWRNGEFVFFEDQLPESRPISLKMPLEGILERGIERARKRRQIDVKLSSKAVFHIRDKALRKNVTENPKILFPIRQVFDVLQEPLTFRDIVMETGLTEFDTASILAENVETGIIEAIEPDVTEVSEEVRKSMAEAEILHAHGRYWESWTRIRKAVREIPGSLELQTLFREYARDFKNDLHSVIVSTDRIPVAIKNVDDALFARFPKDTALGFILSRIDGKSSIKNLSHILDISSDKLMLTLYLLKKADIIKLMKPKGPIPQEMVRRRQYVRNIWERMTNQNNYEILGVNPDVKASQIKSVYFDLAKQFHPDRRPENDPEDVKNRLDQIFVKIRDAYQLLSDQEKRKVYDQKIADSKMDLETQKTRSKAQLQYRIGLKAFQSRKYRIAMEYVRSAIELDPYEPDYYFKMAELCARNPHWYRAGTLACMKAIQYDPEVPEYHAVYGLLLRLEGDLVKAESEFFTTLKFDPENKTARRELLAMGKTVPDLEKKQDTQYSPIPRKKFGENSK